MPFRSMKTFTARAAFAGALMLSAQAVMAQGTLRIGMTASDIPLTTTNCRSR